MTDRVADFGVIGAGVVGLALAHELLLKQPGARVVVFDKEPTVGAHASGRNSGVLHAGFYYAPDSLKAQLTRRGNVMLHRFCAEQGIVVRETGKVVVATDDAQVTALHELARRADANGVPVELIDEQRLRELEPLARTAGTALWSPTTSVAAPLDVVNALARRVQELGGSLELGAPVTSARPGQIVTTRGTWSVGHVVNAAGLYADRVAGWFGMAGDYVMMPFKGLYWYGSWEPGRLTRHVYPVPDARNPFLGVHLTVTVDGRAKIGPTAIPALWREHYRWLGGFQGRELREIAALYPGFFRSPHHDAAGLIRAELPKYMRRVLVNQAKALVPSVDPRDFTLRGKAGVRAQLFDRKTKKLEMDFVVAGDGSSTHVINAVSPAWTSSLAVAEHVVADLFSRTR